MAQLAEKVLIGVVERFISHATNDAYNGIQHYLSMSLEVGNPLTLEYTLLTWASTCLHRIPVQIGDP